MNRKYIKTHFLPYNLHLIQLGNRNNVKNKPTSSTTTDNYNSNENNPERQRKLLEKASPSNKQ